MTAATPGQADDIPDVYVRYLSATFPADLGDFAQHEAAMRWKHLTGEREREFWCSLATAQGGVSRERCALKALDELFKIDSDLRNPWNARALTIVLRGLGRGGTADEEITAALGPDSQPAPGIPLRSDAETAAMLRADLADAEALLARWPKCPAGCSCRIGIEDDPDRNECGCDGPCNGGEQPAPDADVALASIAADRNQLRMALSRIAMGTAGDPSVAADKALAASSENARRTPALGALESQPAPEMPAALPAFARVLSWFEQFGTHRTAIATRAQLAHAYQDGGLTVPEELRRFL